MQSQRGEVKAREFDCAVEELTKEGVADFQAVIASVEADLQAFFDEIQRSDDASEVVAAFDNLQDHRQALLDRLKLQRVITEIRFSEDCPFCLTELFD